jgi:hypothetical protein
MRFTDVSRDALVLKVAMLEAVGIPVLQLGAELHRPEDVLVQLSVVWALPATASRRAIATAPTKRRAPGEPSQANPLQAHRWAPLPE